MTKPGAERWERAWVAAAAALVACAVAARVHNAFAYPPLHDFDGPGHALNVFALYEGRLPDPRTWSGFHPPLYYAAGAALWRLLPESVPVHAMLRLLSAAAGFGALALAWRTLCRLVPPSDAAASVALLACAPVFAIATSMLGNETTCALFATAALARLARPPAASGRLARHAAWTGVWAGLAALAKSTGLAVIAAAGLTYLWHLRRTPRAALAAASLSVGVALGLCAPFYAWLVVETGGPGALVSGGKPSDAAGSEMGAQPPGERRATDYFALPPATWLAPVAHAPGLYRSVPGLLYASTWADGHGQFLPPGNSRVLRAAAATSIAGLLPTGLAALGLLRLVRDPRLRAPAAGPLAFSVLLGSAFLAQTWLVPRFSAVKASYLLAALLPGSLALGAGLASFRGATRAALRGALLAIAGGACALTWYGWWS